MTDKVDRNAPVVIFVYKRVEATRKTFSALRRNLLAEKTELFVYSDAPATNNDAEEVEAVRDYIRSVDGFKKISIIDRETNFGLAGSIIDGVTDIVKKFGKIIVLEDDLVTSPYFLKFMNDALTIYENVQEIVSVSGYSLPLNIPLPEVYFLPGTECWGWGTWERGWELFRNDGETLLPELKERKLMKKFNLHGSFLISPESLLKKQIKGEVSSWAICWNTSAVLHNKCTIFPSRTLVNNIGLGTGTHCVTETDIFNSGLSTSEVNVESRTVSEDPDILRAVRRFYRKAHLNLAFSHLKNKLKPNKRK